jgi:ribosome-binding factor A
MISTRLEHALTRQLQQLITTLSDPRSPLIVTVKRARLSRDGSSAEVAVSTLEPGDGAPMLAALNGASGYLQHELTEQMALRSVPKLHFVLMAPGGDDG